VELMIILQNLLIAWNKNFNKMIMSNLLKILFIEDLPSDVDLAILELRKENLNFEYHTVCSKPDLINALKEFRPDLIISDYMMPTYNGLQALRDVKAINGEVPFILFTGSINEETAVECLKSGAEDYVIKEHIARLPFAVKEALEQVSIRKEKRASDLLLENSEQKLLSIFRAAPVGIGLVIERIIMEVNDVLCNMVGYSRSELIGKSSEILYSTREEFLKVGINKYKQIEETGTGSVETTFKCKDGKILKILLSSSPLDQKDHSKGITFTVLDITAGKNSEIALRESEERYRNLYNDALIGLYRTTPEGEILLTNNLLVKMLGFQSFNEIASIDLNHSGIGTTHNRKYFMDQIEKYGEVKDMEAIWVSRYGEEIFVKESAKAIYNEEGKILYYDGTVEDISEKKKAEKEIIYSFSILNASLESTADGILITNGSGGIVKWNHKFVTMWGISEELLDKHDDKIAIDSVLDKLVHPSKFLSTIEDLYSNPEKSSFDTLEFSDGRIFERYSLPQKIDNKVVGRVWSFRDVTERLKAAEQMIVAKEKAEASDKLKTTFLNNISHEVRTPLNGILGFAELLTQPDLTNEEREDSLVMLHQGSSRLLKTITNYVDISLLTSGNMTVNNKTFIPALLLKKIFDLYYIQSLAKKLELVLKIPDKQENISITSDPEIFQKIFCHLLDNAINFTDKGTISFGYSIKENEIEFFVKDTGIGIGQKSIKSIFDHFIKEERDVSKPSEGSGLGLSITKGMIEILCGSIRVESEIEVGSCFFFSLPLLKEKDNMLPDAAYSERKKIKAGITILVAEDDEANFYYINAVLSRETEAKVLHADNGKSAVELIKLNPDITLILMDIKMPIMDGLEATRQIKLFREDVPVIALTAYAMLGDEQRIYEAGCDGYLSKPINRKALVEKISEFVNLK
jgi:PAS domain S-box-containing protein